MSEDRIIDKAFSSNAADYDCIKGRELPNQFPAVPLNEGRELPEVFPAVPTTQPAPVPMATPVSVPLPAPITTVPIVGGMAEPAPVVGSQGEE